MSWIERVRLENFQSHVDTTLTLNDGLNVIVGQSDSGKTAIIRAIRWALFNQPRGTDFIHVGANFVRVTVTFSTGVTIIRERTASKNRYIIQEQGKEEMVLEGFGFHVPKEVLDAHGMKPLRIDQDTQLNLHLSGQLEGPFLLEQTSSVRAKTIGRMSGAHILDMAIRDTTRDTTKLTQYIRAHAEDMERLEAALEPYSFLDEAKSELESVGKKLAYIEARQKKRGKLLEIATALKALHEQRQKVKKQITSLRELDKWQLNYERFIQKVERHKRLEKWRAYHEELNRSLCSCHQWLKKTAEIESATLNLEHILHKTTRLAQLVAHKTRNEQQKRIEQAERKVLQMTAFATTKQKQQIETMKDKLTRLKTLQQLSFQLQRQNDEQQSVNTLKNNLQRIDEATKILNDVETLERRLGTLKEIAHKYDVLQKRTKDGALFIEAKRKEEERLLHEYKHLLLETGTCPTCGSQLKKETIQQQWPN